MYSVSGTNFKGLLTLTLTELYLRRTRAKTILQCSLTNSDESNICNPNMNRKSKNQIDQIDQTGSSMRHPKPDVTP